MLWTYNQHIFSGGRLDKELMGRQDLSQYHKGASELRNFTIRRQGNLAKRRGTNLACVLNNLMGATAKYRLIPLVFDKNEGYYIMLTGGRAYLCSRDGIRVTSGGFSKDVTTSTAYSVASGVSDAQIGDIDFVQSGDTVFFVHHEKKPFRIVFYRNADETHEAFSLERKDLDFASQAHAAPAFSVSSSGMDGSTGATKTITYTATYVGDDGVESFPANGKRVSYKLPWPEGGKFTLTVTSSGQDKPRAYNIYKDDGSGFGYIGTIPADSISGTTNSGSFEDDYITPDLSMTPPDKTSRKTFSTKGDFPSVVSLYQQRLMFGCSDNAPFTFWLSNVGDLYNFSTHQTIREDDSITATLAATEQPEINHALLAKELMLFANSGEWEVAPVTGNTLSYKTVSAKMQSAIGAARWVKPMLIGDEIIFADATGERVLATRYNFATDGYESQELTVLSQWLFRNNMIMRMAYRRSPDSTIHTVMEDGSVSHMVYMKEHDVCAWSRHDLGGGWLAKDVACSKAVFRGSTDLMYLVYNPSTKKFELWSERDDTPIRNNNTIADFVCMDACRDLAVGAKVPQGMTAIGKTSAARFEAGRVVTEDAICGYPFESKFESIYPDAKSGEDSTQMEIMNPTEVKIRTIDSSSFQVGALALGAANDRTVAIQVGGAGGKVTLGDCDVKVVLTGVNTRDPRIRISHTDVWPLNILSLGITYQVEPENQNGGGNG